MQLSVRQSRYLHYNAGAFVSGDEALLIDPGILEDEIAAIAADAGSAPVTTVVLTHSDWDHVLGPEHLPPTRLVTHAAYESNLDPDGIRYWLGRLETAADVSRDRVFEPPRPTDTFDDELELRVGEATIHLEHAPGHTADMLTAFEPVSATLWAADVLSDVELPLVCHDLAAYEQTLERIASMTVRSLVPGHGAATAEPIEIRARIDEDRRYLQELRAAVEAAIAGGLSLDDTLATHESPTLRRSDEDAEIHRLNVEKVYADLGGDADPDDVGYARVWKELTGR